MIEMFHRAKNDYAVLTTYVADIEQNDTDPTNVPQLCMVEMSNTWRNLGTKFCERLLRPKLQNVAWGAGLSFNKCHAELNVPYDPFLPNVFNGEELSRGIRFFTHGYDMYTPDKVLVTHDYHGHQSNPNVHTWGRKQNDALLRGGDRDEKDLSSDMSIFMDKILQISPSVTPNGTDRLNVLMGITKNPSAFAKIAPSRYGLGDRRTLQDSIEFSGFDPVKRKMTKNTCGNLAWVPFEEDDNYGLEKNLRRPLWPDESVLTMRVAQQTEERPRIENASLETEMQKVPRKLLTAEDAVRNDKTEILLLLSIVVFAAIGIVLGRHRVYALFRSKKTARLVV